MTTSGLTTFLPVFDDLLLEAWERLGLSPTILTGDVARSARRSLQLMLLDWTTGDTQLWQVDQQSIVTAPGVGIYLGPSGTVDVLEMWIKVNRSDLTLTGIGRDDFASLPVKATLGRPTQFWCERRLDDVVLHLWPVPDATYPLFVNRLRLPQDVGALSQSSDVPVLWSEAVAAGLAARLALKYAPTRYEMLKAEAAETYGRANDEDRERVPLRIVPNIRSHL